MTFPSKEIVGKVKQQYPEGTVVELVKMDDAQAPPIGTKGVVITVDDTANILVNWESGSGLNVVYGEDEVKIIGDAQVDKGAFLRYEDVRKSGAVNMLSRDVLALASITKQQHDYILRNYSHLETIYLGGK